MSEPRRISRAAAGQHRKLRALMHLDGCHRYTNVYHCRACGGQLALSGERGRDDYMLDLDDCERCRAIAGGARRLPSRITYAAPSTEKRKPCHER